MKKHVILSITILVVFFGISHVASAQKAGNQFYDNFVGGAQGSGNALPGGSKTDPGALPGGSKTDPGALPGGSSTSDAPEKLDDPLGESVSIEGLLLKLFEIILYVGIPIVAFFLIWSGFMFVTAQGNPEKIETAKSRLLYTIIGAILLLGAWTISQAIKGTLEDIKRGGTALLYKDHLL